MKEDKFIKENSHIWSGLEATLMKLKAKGFKTFEKNELDQFINSYNSVCSHLSYCRTNYGNTATTEYLNRLTAASHSYIYTTRTSTIKNLLSFFTHEFPNLVRKNYIFILLSMGLFVLGVMFSFIYTTIFPENATAFLPQSIVEGLDFENNSSSSWDKPVISSIILTNNIRVGFMAFALGITLGIGTSLALIYNGFMIGALASLAFVKGADFRFWSLILPHGILELFAIFVCGGAGLIIGYSIINPGINSRRDSFILKGKTAIKLVCGTIPIFVVAGFIEGFITPMNVPELFKYVFSGFTLLLLLIYIYFPLFKTRRQ